MRELVNFIYDENGQGMVEYGLIIGLVVVVSILALSIFGDKVERLINKQIVNDALDKAGN
ncbi:MAG: Flp family type IVb pilin [Lachnospiraceae bacterium]|nr:Flp family type IVb pilin [Lachnospiraceae bacterium]